MNIFRTKSSQVPGPADALPGRDEAIPVPARHAVLGTPLLPPFPEGVEFILLGMGCFWGAERLFWQLPGVYTTAVGYAGGSTPNPTYREVCCGRTGHAEVVLVAFDPTCCRSTSSCARSGRSHDPTQGMRQGNDVGTQYRSAIYWTTDAQQARSPARRATPTRRRSSARHRGADHDRDRRGRPVLPGRGVPPAVPAEEPERVLRPRRHGRVLPDRRRRSRRASPSARGAQRCAPRQPGRRVHWPRAARPPRRSGSGDPRAARGGRRRTRAGAAAARGQPAARRRRSRCGGVPRGTCPDREALGAREDHRAVCERVGRSAVMQEGSRGQDVDVEAGLPLRGLAAERRDRDGVLDEPARVGVMPGLGRRGGAEARAVRRVAEDPLGTRRAARRRGSRRRGSRGSRRGRRRRDAHPEPARAGRRREGARRRAAPARPAPRSFRRVRARARCHRCRSGRRAARRPPTRAPGHGRCGRRARCRGRRGRPRRVRRTLRVTAKVASTSDPGSSSRTIVPPAIAAEGSGRAATLRRCRRQPRPRGRPPLSGAPIRHLPGRRDRCRGPAVRRDQRGGPAGAARAQPLQRRAPDPPGDGPRGGRGRRARALDRRGRARARAAAVGLVARAGGDGPRRRPPATLGTDRDGQGRRLRLGRACAPTSARSTGPKAGRLALHARRAREPLADLRDLRRPEARRHTAGRAGDRGHGAAARRARTATAPITGSGGSTTTRCSRRSPRRSPSGRW